MNRLAQMLTYSPLLLSAAHMPMLQALPDFYAENEALARDHNASGFSYAVENGTAFIPVSGVLLHRWPYEFESSFATGYNVIAAKLSAAIADPNVRSIVLDINSPGGQVAGCFELAERIAACPKPIVAAVDALACSAAFALACAADKTLAVPSATVGSVGVVATHLNYEKMMDGWGIEITYVYAGDHKIDGNPHQSLPKDVKAIWQESVQKTYDKFVSHVAAHRNMTVDEVTDTQALCYDSDDALDVGFIDAIGDVSNTGFFSEVNMETENEKTPVKASTETAPADANAEVAPVEASTETAPADANAEVAPVEASTEVAEQEVETVSEKDRIQAILGSQHAEGKKDLAEHLAFKTDMTVEAAEATLASFSPDPLAAVMANTEQPEISQEEVQEQQQVSASAKILSNYRQATGAKTKE